MPPAPGSEEPQFLDDDHAAIVTFAETYMDEDERGEFVNTLMERRGYTRVESWGPPDNPSPPRRPAGGGRPAPGGGGRRGGYFKR